MAVLVLAHRHCRLGRPLALGLALARPRPHERMAVLGAGHRHGKLGLAQPLALGLALARPRPRERMAVLDVGHHHGRLGLALEEQRGRMAVLVLGRLLCRLGQL